MANEVGGMDTTEPEKVSEAIKAALDGYHAMQRISLEDIVSFHEVFESIHPFQDGNGRVGRLVMFKECLKHDVMPFIIDAEHKAYYYRGLKEYRRDKAYLIDTCQSAQDRYKLYCEKLMPDKETARITSYNVCYTKLLRNSRRCYKDGARYLICLTAARSCRSPLSTAHPAGIS